MTEQERCKYRNKLERELKEKETKRQLAKVAAEACKEQHVELTESSFQEVEARMRVGRDIRKKTIEDEIVDVIRHVCIQQRTAEDSVDVHVPRIQVQLIDKIGDEQFIDNVIDVPFVLLSKVPILQRVQQIIEVSQVLFIVSQCPISQRK